MFQFTFSVDSDNLEEVCSKAFILCNGTVDLLRSKFGEKLSHIVCYLDCIGCGWVDKYGTLECLSDRQECFLCLFSRVLGEINTTLTPLTLPARINSVGLSVMNVPSITGLKTKVPKKPLLLISAFAVWSISVSTLRRHSRASSVESQLVEGSANQ